MPFGTPFTNDVLPMWAEVEEVLHKVREEVKPSPSIRPRKPSQMDYLVSCRCTFLILFYIQQNSIVPCIAVTELVLLV